MDKGIHKAYNFCQHGGQEGWIQPAWEIISVAAGQSIDF
jgi:hypothetical protein